jgi:hypothetical protein
MRKSYTTDIFHVPHSSDYNRLPQCPLTYYGFLVKATTMDCDTTNIDIVAHYFVFLVLRTKHTNLIKAERF